MSRRSRLEGPSQPLTLLEELKDELKIQLTTAYSVANSNTWKEEVLNYASVETSFMSVPKIVYRGKTLLGGCVCLIV